MASEFQFNGGLQCFLKPSRPGFLFLVNYFSNSIEIRNVVSGNCRYQAEDKDLFQMQTNNADVIKCAVSYTIRKAMIRSIPVFFSLQ